MKTGAAVFFLLMATTTTPAQEVPGRDLETVEGARAFLARVKTWSTIEEPTDRNMIFLDEGVVPLLRICQQRTLGASDEAKSWRKFCSDEVWPYGMQLINALPDAFPDTFIKEIILDRVSGGLTRVSAELPDGLKTAWRSTLQNAVQSTHDTVALQAISGLVNGRTDFGWKDLDVYLLTKKIEEIYRANEDWSPLSRFNPVPRYDIHGSQPLDKWIFGVNALVTLSKESERAFRLLAEMAQNRVPHLVDLLDGGSNLNQIAKKGEEMADQVYQRVLSELMQEADHFPGEPTDDEVDDLLSARAGEDAVLYWLGEWMSYAQSRAMGAKSSQTKLREVASRRLAVLKGCASRDILFQDAYLKMAWRWADFDETDEKQKQGVTIYREGLEEMARFKSYRLTSEPWKYLLRRSVIISAIWNHEHFPSAEGKEKRIEEWTKFSTRLLIGDPDPDVRWTAGQLLYAMLQSDYTDQESLRQFKLQLPDDVQSETDLAFLLSRTAGRAMEKVQRTEYALPFYEWVLQPGVELAERPAPAAEWRQLVIGDTRYFPNAVPGEQSRKKSWAEEATALWEQIQTRAGRK